MDTFRPHLRHLMGLAIASTVALWTLTVMAPGASALSCADPGVGGVAGIPDLVAGDWFDTPFFESYDFAITGTVTAISTIEDEGAELPTLVTDTVVMSAPSAAQDDPDGEPTPPVESADVVDAQPTSTTATAAASSNGTNRTALALTAIAVVIALGVLGLWRRDHRNADSGL